MGRIKKNMNTLIKFFHGVYSFFRLVFLPTEILLDIFAKQYAIRFTKAGREAERELQESADRDSRFACWVEEAYPDFSFEDCPVDPEDPNFDSLHSEWIEQIRDMWVEFHRYEEENGIFLQSSSEIDSSSSLRKRVNIKGVIEGIFYTTLFVGYTYLVVAVIWVVIAYFWSLINIA